MKTRSENLIEAATLLRQALSDRLAKLAVENGGKTYCTLGMDDIRRAACEAVPEVFDTLNPPATPLEVINVWDAAGMGLNDAAFKRWFKDTHPTWIFPEKKSKGIALRYS